MLVRVNSPAQRAVAAQRQDFPLQISENQRYLVCADGRHFFVHADTPWMIVNQLTDSEIEAYLDDRQARGFNAILIEAPGFAFTSQNPATNNVDGQAPFTSMAGSWNWVLNNAFWSRVDLVVDLAKTRGILVILNPAYLGFNGGSEGCMTQVSATSDGTLQAYGASLANRYTQGNVMWCMGGDFAGNSTQRNKQWQIVTGIRSVRTSDLITAHGAPGDSAFDSWSGYTGFNLNSAYPRTNDIHSKCLTEYERGGPMPFWMLEGIYEGEPDPPTSEQRVRLQAYQSLLNGACGHAYGNNPIWHFESPNTLYDYSGTWESNLNSQGAQDMARFKAFVDAFEWWKLEPRTNSSLVSSSLSSGDSRVCPALASDGSFALIYVPSSQSITLVKSALAPSLLRVDLFNPTTGETTNHTASTSNSGTLSVATGGERVVIVRAA